MSKTTTFEQNVATSGEYLWSNAANWSNGVPTTGDSVVVISPTNYSDVYLSADDIGSLSLSTLTLGSGSSVNVLGQLVVTNLDYQAPLYPDYSPPDIETYMTASFSADNVYGFNRLYLIGYFGGHILYNATAAAIFCAEDSGTSMIELTQQPSASDQFMLSSGGTIQFDAVSIGTTIGNAGTSSLIFASYPGGNSIELPGSSVVSVSIGLNDIKITTDSTSLEFVNVSYYHGMPVGFTSHFDASTGLECVTFGSCYCPGTRIATDRGEVSVERLAIGDRVATADGQAETIRWIGRRTYGGRFVAKNPLMLPVTIRAGALANGVPHTDLHVSPGHAIWVDGQLVPAGRLVNGVTITQAGRVTEVTYLHVELDRHALLLANGAPAESFLEATGARAQFHNAAEFHTLYPDAPSMAPMQPRLEDGFALQFIQDRLAARAGMRPTAEPAGALRGYVDQVGPDYVCGWAQDIDSPEEPVALEITSGGMPVLCALANAWRADLRQAGLGSGFHAFNVKCPAGLKGLVTVQRVSDGALLPNAEHLVSSSALLAA
jgi:hypothetical protein